MRRVWHVGLLVLLLLGCASDPAVDPAATLDRTGRFAHKSFVVERLPSGGIALEYTPGLARWGRMAMILVGSLFAGATLLGVASGVRGGPSERTIAVTLGLSLLGGAALCTQETARARTLLDPYADTLVRSETDSLGRTTVHPAVPLVGARFVVAEHERIDPVGSNDSRSYHVMLEHSGRDSLRVVSFDRRAPAQSLRDWLAARVQRRR